MGTKNIAITEDVYERIKSLKYPNESFSKGLRRMINKKRLILEFAGAWKEISDTEIKEMKKNILKMRKSSIRLNEVIKKVNE